MGKSKFGVAATLVHVRALALPTMFPDEVRVAVTRLPYPVACVVAPPEAATLLYGAVSLGDTLVVVGGERVALITRHELDLAAAVSGALQAALGVRAGLRAWSDGEDAADVDPFEVLGVGPDATFDEVRAAWRARLMEYHPDKYVHAGAKIKAVAADESRRLNAAYARIAAQAQQRPLPKV